MNTKLRENEILVYMYLINTKFIQTFYIEDDRLNFRFVKNCVISIKFLLYFSLRKKSRWIICLSSSRVDNWRTVLYNLDMHKKHLLKSCTLILCLKGFSYIWNKVTCNLHNLLRFFALLQCFTGIEAQLWYFTRFAQIASSSLVLFTSHSNFHCRKCHALWFFSLCYIKVRSSKKSVLEHLLKASLHITFHFNQLMKIFVVRLKSNSLKVHTLSSDT